MQHRPEAAQIGLSGCFVERFCLSRVAEVIGYIGAKHWKIKQNSKEINCGYIGSGIPKARCRSDAGVIGRVAIALSCNPCVGPWITGPSAIQMVDICLRPPMVAFLSSPLHSAGERSATAPSETSSRPGGLSPLPRISQTQPEPTLRGAPVVKTFCRLEPRIVPFAEVFRSSCQSRASPAQFAPSVTSRRIFSRATEQIRHGVSRHSASYVLPGRAPMSLKWTCPQF